MEWEGNAAGGAGAGRCEASRDVVIVLPAGSAAVRQGRQQEHQYQQRQWEKERERELEQQQHPAAGFSGPDFTQPPEKVYYKTRLCEKFEAGKCAYEDGCTFAHGFEELRPPLPVPPSLIRRRSPLPLPPRPPSPPASGEGLNGGYHVKLCFEFRDTGACHRGDRCVYAHTSAAEMPFPGGPRSVEHALKKYSPGGVHRSSGGGGSGYALAAGRALPAVPVRAAADDGRKVTRLELLSRKKTSGIYGDWPEQD